MAFDEFKYRILNQAFNLAGMFIANHITKTDYEGQEKMLNDYYEELKGVASVQEKEMFHLSKKQGQLIPLKQPILMNEEKIKSGTACLPCSRDHFTTTSAALKEALRFAKTKGVHNDEVMKRIGIALEELNIMERMDLSAENIKELKGKDKELADWGLEQSRTLRHRITSIRTSEDLEKVAIEASEIKTKFMKNIWQIATTDGTIEKLCKDLKDEERERCIGTVNKILEDKEKSL